ncbi:rhodanese-like domain-containing protein [Bacillus cereus]|uniref:rhodanese-like domain-containing protein n=1 Tax=Bacillus cereus TaxID=1396 RepID=UPI003C2E7F4E
MLIGKCGNFIEKILNRFLDETKQIYVICRTGNRSDVACQMLNEKGYLNVKNVIPGMLGWQGNVEK